MNASRAASAGAGAFMQSWTWGRFVTGRGLTLFLTACFLLTVAWPIQHANWVPNLPPLTLIVLFGFALGASFAMREWPAARAHGVALATGVVFVGLVVLGLAGPGGPVQRVANVVNDLRFWMEALPTDEVRGGVLEFAIFILALFWAFGYATGWLVVKRSQGWGSVLVGGLIVGITLGSLAEATTFFLVLYMAASVMVLIHLVSVRRLSQWRASRVNFDPVAALSHSVAVLAFGLAVTLAVGVFPTPSWAPLRNTFAPVQTGFYELESMFSRMFNGLPSRRTYRTLVYDKETSFRGNPNLTDDLLFTVRGDSRQYWRARVYTTYTGRGWTSPRAVFSPFDEEAVESPANRTERTYEFRVEAATDTLFTAGDPVSFSQRAEGLTDPGTPWEVLQARFLQGREFFPTRLKLQYSSVGSIANASSFQLREASGPTPGWVSDTYLQLPPTLPPRVRRLAVDVAPENLSTYDRVLAVRDFLLTYPYNLDIVPPPAGADGVEHFLFHSQTGYCDYYASAMVVLLRSIGIPARYVVGYAPGNFNDDLGVYEVLDLHYHSWPEVYFPGYGWVAFEPTPANAIEFGGSGETDLTAIPQLPAGSDIEDLAPEDEEEEGSFLPVDGIGGGSSATLVVLGVLGGVLAVLALFAWYQWWWRLSLLDRSDELYGKMLQLAKVLGMPRRPEQTPREYGLFLGELLPAHAGAIRRIVTAYERGRYGNQRFAPLAEIKAAEDAWSELRWALIKLLIRPRATADALPRGA